MMMKSKNRNRNSCGGGSDRGGRGNGIGCLPALGGVVVRKVLHADRLLSVQFASL